MSFLRKLLLKYRSKNSIIKYGVYALLFLYIIALLQIWKIRYNLIDHGERFTGLQAFSYRGKFSRQKYILLWNSYYMMENNSEQIFPYLQCPVSNCIFSEDKGLLDGDYTKFDAILFTENILKPGRHYPPEKRSKSQIYVFTTLESSYNIPACEVDKDDFFNLTFTYRLDSDVVWPYFYVRNETRHIVAPSTHVQWQKYDKRAIPTSIQKVLHSRTKAAAWLVSHCDADSSRDDYLTRLQEHLYHFSLQIDVFGSCSKIKCANDDCAVMFRKNYYFYMAFENSFSEDYVTEKVLHGYNNYVVPIVYGGANYTRFLPPGSYLNARKFHPYNLAYIMHQAIKNPAKYHEFFRWTNYYTIDDTNTFSRYHPLCDLCKALNSKKLRRQRRYSNFRLWWNRRNGFKWCLSEAYWNETSLVHVDSAEIFNTY